jgi:hypothetical protein
MCNEAGVLLIYLPPYSPDYNPIEQSFNQIKQWMRKNRDKLQHCDSFEDFFEWALEAFNVTGDPGSHSDTLGTLGKGLRTVKYSWRRVAGWRRAASRGHWASISGCLKASRVSLLCFHSLQMLRIVVERVDKFLYSLLIQSISMCVEIISCQ